MSVHGIAYPVAALHPGMRLLEPADIVAAFVAVVVLALLNSPPVDPTRLEVRSQTGRLLRGAVTPDDFNFDRLPRLGRDGKEALATLVRHPNPEIAQRARMAAVPSYDHARAMAAEGTVAARLRALLEGTPGPSRPQARVARTGTPAASAASRRRGRSSTRAGCTTAPTSSSQSRAGPDA